MAGAAFAGLLVWSLVRQRRWDQGQKLLLERMGFHRCPEQKAWLEETITRIENNRHYRYEVSDPRRLPGEFVVYHYTVRSHRRPDEAAYGDEELLLPLKRPSPAGLVLAIKPSTLAPGRATRLLGALAAGPWDSQPDDLERIDLPRELANTNLLAALGPPGASLYDLVDAKTVSAAQGLGDAGAIFMQCRDDWCLVSCGGKETPFRVDKIVEAMRSLR